MKTLFGIPVTTLAVTLIAICVALLGTVGILGLRNRVLVRLGIRNVPRRRGRTVLIVVGLMLATTIIATSLATGDTLSTSIRNYSVRALGNADEIIASRGSEWNVATGLEGRPFFPEDRVAPVERAARVHPAVDGVTPAIIDAVAVVDEATRQSEPRVTLFAPDPERLSGFGTIRDVDGNAVDLGALGADEVFITRSAAEELDAESGHRIRVLAAGTGTSYTVAAVVDYDGTGGATDNDAAVLMPLEQAQRLVGRPDQVKFILVSNTGDHTSGARHSDDVVDTLTPMLTGLELDAQPVKQKALDLADQVGNGFLAVFTTFGTFSIAAGILLVFLIFVMLAAERRTEMGIARAVGTRRGHLTEMFVFEGAVYDLAAAAIGALLGAVVAFLMVLGLGQIPGDTVFDLGFAMTWTSIVIAYCLGVVLTFVVVTFSAWRVSRLNIVTAIRNLPSPVVLRRRRRGLVLAAVGIILGVMLTASGVSQEHATPFLLGVSLCIISLIPLVKALGLSDRIAFTIAGVLLVVWWLLPNDVLIANYRTDFSIWITGGLVIVIGATWAFVYNADLVLGLVGRLFARWPRVTPVAKLASAYPLRSRFRTGVTVSMFTLVVFTLVVATTTSSSFISAVDDVETFGGGFDIVADTPLVSSIEDLPSAIRAAGAPTGPAIAATGAESVVTLEAAQVGAGREPATVPVHGLDRGFLDTTSYELAATARGYGSARDVWEAVKTTPGLAVVDALAVPRRANWNFGPPPDFRLSGFFLEDATFDPITVDVRDPQTGRPFQVTVIGVLPDTAPLEFTGIFTSQDVVAPLGERTHPVRHHVQLAPGADATQVARRLEATFLSNGMEATVVQDALDDAIATSVIFNRLINGFIGLGLVVGVAALAVISARSVVERRQQIGVLRSLGFHRRMIQGVFLLEAAFIALASIVLGTLLGLAIAYNVVADSGEEPSWESMSFVVPWVSYVVIFAIVFVVSMLATLAPAVRASRVYPAEALRYE